AANWNTRRERRGTPQRRERRRTSLQPHSRLVESARVSPAGLASPARFRTRMVTAPDQFVRETLLEFLQSLADLDLIHPSRVTENLDSIQGRERKRAGRLFEESFGVIRKGRRFFAVKPDDHSPSAEALDIRGRDIDQHAVSVRHPDGLRRFL